MIHLDVHHDLPAGVRAAVCELVTTVEHETGHRPLSDHLWLDLVHGGRGGFVAVVAWSDDVLAGYCQLSDGHGSWVLALVLPSHDRTPGVGEALIGAALDEIAARGGGQANWWAFDPDVEVAAIAAASGLREGRTLYQMRVPLPLPDSAGLGHRVATRAFVPGRDEQAWLEVNNAAFAEHAEQGGWDLATLRQREHEPWFDPEGFLLHERDSRLAAFCWTKVHDDTDPVLGEIYVIAVHPDFHGLGLGRALTVAGLAHLAGRGITTGMLYVDGANVAAVGLYTALGFTIHRTDRAYVGEVPATSNRGHA